MKIQLKNGNTVSIDLDDYLNLTDEQWDKLMKSDYGSYVPDPFYRNRDIDLSQDLDLNSEH